jgi:hypothetical protein
MVYHQRSEDVQIGPEQPLARKGLTVRDQLVLGDHKCLRDTFLIPHLENPDLSPKNAIDLLCERGDEFFFILNQLVSKSGNALRKPRPLKLKKIHQKTFDEMKKQGIIIGDESGAVISNKKGSIGHTFEYLVLRAVEACNIGATREVKVEYPFKSGVPKFDPDGAKYDILAGVDLTRLMWIECKKPMYYENSSDNLRNVVSREPLEIFWRRARRLRPEIAVFLVDTKDDYTDRLQQIFTQHFLTRGYFVNDRFEELDQIVACLCGFMYLCRNNHRSARDSYKGLKRTIKQVLFDSRIHRPVSTYDKSPFRVNPH